MLFKEEIYVLGRPGSGRQTFKKILAEQSITDVEVIESPHQLSALLEPGDRVVFIDAPAILCLQRRNTSIKAISNADETLKYVTELPNCTIIKNDTTLDHFRKRVKDFISTIT